MCCKRKLGLPPAAKEKSLNCWCDLHIVQLQCVLRAMKCTTQQKHQKSFHTTQWILNGKCESANKFHHPKQQCKQTTQPFMTTQWCFLRVTGEITHHNCTLGQRQTDCHQEISKLPSYTQLASNGVALISVKEHQREVILSKMLLHA